MADLALIETGNGGDLILRGNDLVAAEGYENMPYLSMFGGASWWGNELLLPKATRFNATTEDVLKQVSLGSSGRQAILNAVTNDLKPIADSVPDTKITQSVSVSNDRAEIDISINGQQFDLNWNPATEFLNYRV